MKIQISQVVLYAKIYKIETFLFQNSHSGKSRLIFPNLSMLDVSNNNLREIPPNIHELSNLSVLNLSGNLGNLNSKIYL